MPAIAHYCDHVGELGACGGFVRFLGSWVVGDNSVLWVSAWMDFPSKKISGNFSHAKKIFFGFFFSRQQLSSGIFFVTFCLVVQSIPTIPHMPASLSSGPGAKPRFATTLPQFIISHHLPPPALPLRFSKAPTMRENPGPRVVMPGSASPWFRKSEQCSDERRLVAPTLSIPLFTVRPAAPQHPTPPS